MVYIMHAIVGTRKAYDVPIVIVLFMFVDILENLQAFFFSKGVSVNFINKILRLSRVGNILNGRRLDYDAALSLIPLKIIMGYGIGTFEYYTAYPYPHNLVLQLLFDGGILLLLIVLIPLFSVLPFFYRTCTKQELPFISFLLFTSLPASFLSGDIWRARILWLFYAYYITWYMRGGRVYETC